MLFRVMDEIPNNEEITDKPGFLQDRELIFQTLPKLLIGFGSFPVTFFSTRYGKVPEEIPRAFSLRAAV